MTERSLFSLQSLVMFRLALLCSMLSGAGVAAPDAGVPLIPREVLFGNPQKGQPRLSPDGKKLGFWRLTTTTCCRCG